MPNRMLRDWTDSLKLDGISSDAERLFVRLIMKADDYGRFHDDVRLLKAGCFPLIESLRTNDLSRWLDELSHRQLILRYQADGRSVLAIVDYGQRLKNSRAKFPPFPGKDADWMPLSGDSQKVPGTSGNLPAEEKRRETEVELEIEEKTTPPNPRRGNGGELDALVNAIWEICPKFAKERSSRSMLLQQLKKLPAGVAGDGAIILESLRAWCVSESWTRENGQYVPGIHRWIKDGKWQSKPARAAGKKGKFAGTEEDIDLPL